MVSETASSRQRHHAALDRRLSSEERENFLRRMLPRAFKEQKREGKVIEGEVEREKRLKREDAKARKEQKRLERTGLFDTRAKRKDKASPEQRQERVKMSSTLQGAMKSAKSSYKRVEAAIVKHDGGDKDDLKKLKERKRELAYAISSAEKRRSRQRKGHRGIKGRRDAALLRLKSKEADYEVKLFDGRPASSLHFLREKIRRLKIQVRELRRARRDEKHARARAKQRRG